MRQKAPLRPVALAATILTAASGCDKPIPASAAPAAAAAESAIAAPLTAIDPAAPPHMLFHVFGERTDPRIMPLAALVDGEVRPLALSPAGWRTFDSLYHRPGAAYTVYRGGRAAGTARVRRGMWQTGDAPLYALPGCTNPIPLGAARLAAPPRVGFLVEYLASDATLGARPPHPVEHLGDAQAVARIVGERVAEAAGLEAAALRELDFRASAVRTGAGTPTLVITYIDPSATTRDADDRAVYLFILADLVDGRYIPTYTRLVRGAASSAEYRRYVDHLDLTGDGVDELVLEGWSSGRESFMLILQRRQGQWIEILRSQPSWCGGLG
ncbi:MAG TPA: hypothetical protein VFS08_16395 [Gemmatimonadaceae bacterium]|nr:hypothetical protein [Gemmatimonadaceae bacterium]